MRLRLKVAILKSGKTQRVISIRTRIPETRLSAIVRGKVDATSAEAVALARELKQTPELLMVND